MDIKKNRKWYLNGSPGVPLLKCRETIVMIRARIYVFLGPSVVWRMLLLKFQMYNAVFHSFVISADIHLAPEMFSLSDLR